MAEYDSYKAREREYERRKAAGETGGNPFGDVNLPSMDDLQKTLGMVANPMSAIPALGEEVAGKIAGLADIPEVADVINSMKANVAEHPIYGGAGKNLGEDVTYDRVDAITGEERDSPNVVNIPLIPEDTSTDIVQGVSDMMGPSAEDLQPVDITGKRKEGTPEGPEQSAQSKVLESEARTSLQKAGASEEDLGLYDKMASKFDMLTFGLHLMASNNGGDLGANVGKALIAARAAKTNKGVAEAAAQAAGREEGRAERKVRVQEQNAATNSRAEDRQRSAGIKPTKAHNDIALSFLTGNPNFKLADSDGGIERLSTVTAEHLAEIEQLNLLMPPERQLSPTQMNHLAATKALQRIGLTKQSTMFGLGDPVYGIE